jgi:2-oxoglutarate ferredoxin oxidoreductase subunit delta
MTRDDASDHEPRPELAPDTPLPEGLPAEKPHPEYRINIYRDWCKGCGLCAAFCPRQCLSLDAEGRPVVEKSERCTGCRWCELHCPDFAICVREKDKDQETAKNEA